MFLNSVLLFVVLFYVYPLKFVFETWLGADRERDVFGGDWESTRTMMTIYAIGYIAVFVVFALLYHHAYRLRTRLGLTESETIYARAHIAQCAVMVAVGFISIAVAQTVPLRWAAAGAGLSYFLIGPAQYFVGSHYGRLTLAADARERKSPEKQPA